MCSFIEPEAALGLALIEALLAPDASPVGLALFSVLVSSIGVPAGFCEASLDSPLRLSPLRAGA